MDINELWEHVVVYWIHQGYDVEDAWFMGDAFLARRTHVAIHDHQSDVLEGLLWAA